MTETQKRIKAYKEALPGLRERVVAVALLLAMSVAMMTSASFAWLTISRAPEVSGVSTNIAANGNLEIALATGDGKTAPGESKVGDSSATEGQTIVNSNITWGNLINLSDPAYGLDNLALRPAQLNTAALLTKPLYGAVYDSDGRIKNLTSDYGYTAWIPATDTVPGHFGASEAMGVRAISSLKRELLGYAADYNAMYQTAEIANLNAANAYTAITQKQEWLDVLAKLLGIHMTATLNSEDQYTNAEITAEDMESLIDMYEAFLEAHDIEADAIAKQLNLELYATYGGNTAAYTPFSKEDILAINFNSDSRIKSNGDFSYDVTTDKGTKTIKITNLKTFLEDYKQLSEDLVTLNDIHAAKNYRWTDSGLQKVINRLMNVDDCLIKKTSESSYKTVGQLMAEFSDNITSALGYMGASCDIVITNGVLYNLEQRVGSSINIQGMQVTAKMYVSSMNLGEQTATITAYVTTSATKPSYFQMDLDYTSQTLNTGADSSAGEAVAEDTYALAVDFWVRTNAVNSYLTLEGNVLLGDAYEVPVMTLDYNGNQVPLYTLTQTFTDEETQETFTQELELYKKEGSDGTVTWYRAVSHTEMTAEALGEDVPVAKVEEKRDVIGYEGENRVWDKTSKDYITADSTTQGVGSCYVYYADTPEDQARSLELLKSLSVAFVDSKGALLATASMDTENYYGESGRFVVPLKLNNDGISINVTGDDGAEVVEYAITPLEQNEPTRITAIVYLDGRGLYNEDVLSAADIQGQLNIQFGSSTEMQPIDNEKLEYETRVVTASVDNTSFNYDTYVGDMISNVTVHVDGAEPTNVKAFFVRKVNATQGSREAEMTFTQSDSGDWVSSYTFTAPGEYVLRSVYLDGIEYVLAEPPTVTITGFTVESLTCDQVAENRHVDVLTAASSTKLDLNLKFATDDEEKMPSTVQARFLRDTDGAAVNINFTFDSTTQIWSGSGTFLNSGEYTLQYLYLDGEPTGLAEAMWITANIKLGMKTAVYTKDITNFKFIEDEMVANGTDELQMQVKIMDNSGAELPGLQDVKLTYRLRNSASTIDTNLTWNPVTEYYEGDIQALQAGAGIWEFSNVTVGGNNISTATTAPVFEMLPPDPPSYVSTGGSGMQYSPNGDAKMQVTLKYSSTATVAAVFRDADGNRYPVIGTSVSTDLETNDTVWSFAVPTNRTGTYSGKQDGYWTLETVYLWNFYDRAGNYVEWAKDENGSLKGGLSLNADGSLAENADRDDEKAMVIDIKSSNGGTDYTVKVVQTITVTFAPNQSKDFGIDANGNITGTFMQSYEGDDGINGVNVTIKDFEGGFDGTGEITIVYNYAGDSQAKGGYTGSNTTAEGGVFTLTLKQDATDKTKFVQSGSQELQLAGTYSPNEYNFTFAFGAQTYSMTSMPANVPEFTVWSKAPTVTISSVSTNPTTARYYTSATPGETEYNNMLSGSFNSKIDDYNAVVYMYFAEVSNYDNEATLIKYPTVTLALSGVPTDHSGATMVFANESDSASACTFTFAAGSTSVTSNQNAGTRIGGGVNGSMGSITAALQWIETYPVLYPAGKQTVNQITVTYNKATYTVDLSDGVTINNPLYPAYVDFAVNDSTFTGTTPSRIYGTPQADGTFTVTLPGSQTWTADGLSAVNGDFVLQSDTTDDVWTGSWKLMSNGYTKYKRNIKIYTATSTTTTWTITKVITGWKVGNTVYKPGDTVEITGDQTVTAVISETNGPSTTQTETATRTVTTFTENGTSYREPSGTEVSSTTNTDVTTYS